MFLGSWVWALSARLTEMTQGAENVPFWLFVVFTATLRTSGALNAVIFSVSMPVLRNECRRRCARAATCCCARRKRASDDDGGDGKGAVVLQNPMTAES